MLNFDIFSTQTVDASAFKIINTFEKQHEINSSSCGSISCLFQSTDIACNVFDVLILNKVNDVTLYSQFIVRLHGEKPLERKNICGRIKNNDAITVLEKSD